MLLPVGMESCMTVSSRFRQGFKEEELITPKQREALAQRKAQLIAEIDQR